jgi:phage gp36-like protein
MYCTIEDLKAQVSEQVLISLTDDEGSAPVSLEEADPKIIKRLNDAIQMAEHEINGYCLTKYPVPFNPIPGLIGKLAVDISLYNLFSRRGYNEDSPDKSIVDRYKTAVKTLESISKGLVSLGMNAPDPVTEVIVHSSHKIFGRNKMRDF